jgi:hypothetical protein
MNKLNFQILFFFSFSKNLRATPDMKTDKQQVASSSSTVTKNTCLGSRIAPSGAVVRLNLCHI